MMRRTARDSSLEQTCLRAPPGFTPCGGLRASDFAMIASLRHAFVIWQRSAGCRRMLPSGSGWLLCGPPAERQAVTPGLYTPLGLLSETSLRLPVTVLAVMV